MRGGGTLKRMSKIIVDHAFNDIISPENLLIAWKEFIKGKRGKKDVQEFMLNLAENLNSLHEDLKNRTYSHGAYTHFRVMDPKLRDIHKATVRDRLLHHAVYRILYPHFDRKFIADSFSCRNFKGTHRAMDRFRDFSREVSKNNTKTCWVLKCDVRKFFASIDQKILLHILRKHLHDADTLWLLEQIISSFYGTEKGKGLPLGNVTSQLLVNVYMNEFDQLVKHELRQKQYIRYADDFVVMGQEREVIADLVQIFRDFLYEKLGLSLHPNKVSIATLTSGVDFLGWVHFSSHRVLRTVTKKRMLRALADKPTPELLISYQALLKHGNAFKLEQEIEKITLNPPKT